MVDIKITELNFLLKSPYNSCPLSSNLHIPLLHYTSPPIFTNTKNHSFYQVVMHIIIINNHHVYIRDMWCKIYSLAPIYYRIDP